MARVTILPRAGQGPIAVNLRNAARDGQPSPDGASDVSGDVAGCVGSVWRWFADLVEWDSGRNGVMVCEFADPFGANENLSNARRCRTYPQDPEEGVGVRFGSFDGRGKKVGDDHFGLLRARFGLPLSGLTWRGRVPLGREGPDVRDQGWVEPLSTVLADAPFGQVEFSTRIAEPTPQRGPGNGGTGIHGHTTEQIDPRNLLDIHLAAGGRIQPEGLQHLIDSQGGPDLE